ncbi:bifunctional N-acetylglucosamine-1-phosphate uridyltransferase/glucosamine-1-phosphate acetyltransferase [Mesorhizobium sp. Root554]|uniref:bifunctional UDP-N-acetylglucosamine diphosphorylase/glucosamine-1-phosphate N-acetyltransferase GlmU n=1 Tax=unclassified Mesorhizobium TaxID=325217 RepID=UPI0006F6F44C|nr:MULTISPECIES: bifunctional UDP-N-acetylglucosamine diphosphorylase/glucosamine-1-phosphate N-acetyltransferase GlmU [unclassified Mesorhizobium]KQZ13059.1 bifunctional N-acetylglucosamine-1-phosphate uridyltransferase/glucosamine-1-phosphate acetyltransferase [Mesorhizobium sp. Root1471]KQZ35577.1 bifunctional N-acetylglucosamine-1-phosphate uridyltransferase/glucosamine-1-phosphate acetyltransferase [Mesorhizobium sp. Root554]
MSQRTCLSIILAAGEGTRMKSALPKVLHKLAGLPLVGHVVKATETAGAGDLALVVGHGAEEMRKAAEKFAPGANIFMQEKRLGTANAVLAARDAISQGYDDVLVIFGDTPLIDPAALTVARLKLAEGAAVVVIGFRTDNPAGYGRLIEKDGKLLAIREDKDCSGEEKKITFCNSGMMAVAGREALAFLDAVGNKNAKGEYYLTDIVEIAGGQGMSVVATETSFESALGINNRAELAEAEAIWQARRRRQAMLDGVTLIAPETVYFSHDTQIGADTLVEPNVWFGPGVTIAEGAKIHAFSHLEGATVASGCDIGPFARLRPGADLSTKAKVGNFCEVKNAKIEEGAKVNHLTYIGDARIGAGANIGAGTITCNYDGYSKFVTDIGKGAFIGSNSSLVAPVSIGDGGYVASGSVITENVPDDALAFGRARQKTLPGKARELRERRAAAAKK